MNKKLLFGSLFLLLVAGLVGYKLLVVDKSTADKNQPKTNLETQKNPDQVQNGSVSNQTAQPTQPIQTVSSDELKKHNSASDCWLAIEGKVYDVTSFITSHPGGIAITLGCGKDATTLFRLRPNGTSHSQRAEQMLPKFYVGDLLN